MASLREAVNNRKEYLRKQQESKNLAKDLELVVPSLPLLTLLRESVELKTIAHRHGYFEFEPEEIRSNESGTRYLGTFKPPTTPVKDPSEYQKSFNLSSDESQSSQDQHAQIQARARSIRQRIYDRYNTIPSDP